MLSKPYRLRKKRDIEITFSDGRFVPGGLVNLKYWVIKPTDYPKRNYNKNDLKLTVIVSKKVDKRAVARNQVKRQIREVLRLLVKDNKIRQGSFIILMATPKILGASYQEIEKSVLTCLKRGKLLR